MVKRRVATDMSSATAKRLATLIRQEVDTRLGTDATLEERSAAAAAFMAEAVEAVCAGMDNCGDEDHGAWSQMLAGDVRCTTNRKNHE